MAVLLCRYRLVEVGVLLDCFAVAWRFHVGLLIDGVGSVWSASRRFGETGVLVSYHVGFWRSRVVVL